MKQPVDHLAIGSVMDHCVAAHVGLPVDQQACASLGRGTTSIVDLNRGGHAGCEHDAGGTSSIWMRTGMRWARRTQVKMGLTVATP